MTDKEKHLLEIANGIMKDNPNLYLTGSLMLLVRGLNKRRDAHDIDFVYKTDNTINIETLKIPEEFHPYEGDGGSPESMNSIKYANKEGLIIDIFASGTDETFDVVNEIKCASVKKMLQFKRHYSLYDDSAKSREKNKIDLNFYYNHNRNDR